MKNFKNPILMDKNEKKRKKRLRLLGLDGPNLLSLQKRARLESLGQPMCSSLIFLKFFLRGG
jgi:hypothetical protein